MLINFVSSLQPRQENSEYRMVKMRKHFHFIFVTILVQRASANMSTLSAATSRITASAMPTTTPPGFRRRYNEQRGVEFTDLPLDMFKLNYQNLRRSQSQIWDWDHWCQLQPKMGNCTKSISRFYYDAQMDQCSTFAYGGCHGNKNNFDDLPNCERHCKGASYMAKRVSDASKFCAMQPNSGLCIGLMTKYYYDLNEGTCKKFSYSGCGGNNNRFDSAGECVATCRGSKYLRSAPVEVY